MVRRRERKMQRFKSAGIGATFSECSCRRPQYLQPPAPSCLPVDASDLPIRSGGAMAHRDHKRHDNSSPAPRILPRTPQLDSASLKHRATQLIPAVEPALPGRQLILAPILWPTMTPTTQQQLAKRVAQLLWSTLAAVAAGDLIKGHHDEHAAQFGKPGDDGASRQAGRN